ncbi:hypothetical protein ABFP60_10615 [Clostridioides difficile]
MGFLIIVIFFLIAFLIKQNSSNSNKNSTSSNYTYSDTDFLNNDSYSLFDSCTSDFHDCDCGFDSSCDCDGGCDCD